MEQKVNKSFGPSVGEPGYLPYCGRCDGLVRMTRAENEFECKRCGNHGRTINGKDMFDRTAPETVFPVSVPEEDLAVRCEQATGPDRELDAEIARNCGFGLVVQTWANQKLYWIAWHGKQRMGPWEYLKDYTASLDAAMTLVPEGWRMAALSDRAEWFCRLETHDFKSVTWGKGSDWITDITAGQERMASAATPALALCTAALRARVQGHSS